MLMGSRSFEKGVRVVACEGLMSESLVLRVQDLRFFSALKV